MTHNDPKEHMDRPDSTPEESSGDTHSGNPNPVDPNDHRSTEHKSGYGGEGGEPRISSNEREKPQR